MAMIIEDRLRSGMLMIEAPRGLGPKKKIVVNESHCRSEKEGKHCARAVVKGGVGGVCGRTVVYSLSCPPAVERYPFPSMNGASPAVRRICHPPAGKEEIRASPAFAS